MDRETLQRIISRVSDVLVEELVQFVDDPGPFGAPNEFYLRHQERLTREMRDRFEAVQKRIEELNEERKK